MFAFLVSIAGAALCGVNQSLPIPSTNATGNVTGSIVLTSCGPRCVPREAAAAAPMCCARGEACLVLGLVGRFLNSARSRWGEGISLPSNLSLSTPSLAELQTALGGAALPVLPAGWENQTCSRARLCDEGCVADAASHAPTPPSDGKPKALCNYFPALRQLCSSLRNRTRGDEAAQARLTQADAASVCSAVGSVLCAGERPPCAGEGVEREDVPYAGAVRPRPQAREGEGGKAGGIPPFVTVEGSGAVVSGSGYVISGGAGRPPASPPATASKASRCPPAPVVWVDVPCVVTPPPRPPRASRGPGGELVCVVPTGAARVCCVFTPRGGNATEVRACVDLPAANSTARQTGEVTLTLPADATCGGGTASATTADASGIEAMPSSTVDVTQCSRSAPAPGNGTGGSNGTNATGVPAATPSWTDWVRPVTTAARGYWWVGIIIGVVAIALLSLLFFLCLCCCVASCRRRRARNLHKSFDPESANVTPAPGWADIECPVGRPTPGGGPQVQAWGSAYGPVGAHGVTP